MVEENAKIKLLKKFREHLHSLAVHCFTGESMKAKKLNLTQAQANLLRFISDGESVMMSEIARRLDVTLGRITRISQELLKQELIDLQRNAQDRRSMLVALTEKGREKKKQLIDIDLMFCEKVLDTVEVQEIERYVSCLGDLNRAIIKLTEKIHS